MTPKTTAFVLASVVAAGLTGFASLSPAWSDDRLSLGDIQSFEVRSFETQDFSAIRKQAPPEMVEYARTALQNDKRLEYKSPGQGVLHFYCDNDFCGRIRATVTWGQDGPVVWETVQRYQKPFSLRFQPDSRKFTQSIVNQLASDYEKAMKASPDKIQIQDAEE